MKWEQFTQNMRSQWWRLNNLYKCKDKTGEVVLFRPWEEQVDLFKGMALRNIILKSRQVGMTTFIQYFMLDTALFKSHINAGVIAHNRDDAQAFFRDKIKFAYDNLHPDLKDVIPAQTDSAQSLGLQNGSFIRVATSLRGSTLQLCHISEYGHICAYRPEKAREVKTGALNTLSPKAICFIESTMEQPFGHFYDMCVESERQQGMELSKLDYKFWFFPWFRRDEYVSESKSELTEEDENYFSDLQIEHGIILSEPQKKWYAIKKREQGDEIYKQFPSVPEEAYRVILENAVYGKEIRNCYKEGRVTKVPYSPQSPVNVFFDIGRDTTALIFEQTIGKAHHIIDYVEAEGENTDWIARVLKEDYAKYVFGKFFFPHDVDNIDYTHPHKWTRKQVLQNLGVSPIKVVPRVKNIDDGISASRSLLNSCWFDKDKCQPLLMCLENYRYDRNKTTGVLSREPVHDRYSHGADAFRQIAQSSTSAKTKVDISKLFTRRLR